jgi:hypothetical protein
MQSTHFSQSVASNSSQDFTTRGQPINAKQRKDLALNAQESICQFFVANAKKESPDWILQQFDKLFITQTGEVPPQIHHALSAIVSLNQEEIFRNTVKRCCYVLINNWSATRNTQYIQELIQRIAEVPESPQAISPTKQRVKKWLKDFFYSEDYRELDLFAAKYNKRDRDRWSHRYASYLLASQSLDAEKPVEQRNAAQLASRQLKEQFKLDLAMYTARSQIERKPAGRCKNPTALGKDALELIQKIIAKRQRFSYLHLANIFRKQIQGISYKRVKRSLLKYLTFDLEDNKLSEAIEIYLSDFIEPLYNRRDREIGNPNLFLRTSNRAIDYLTTQKQGKPTQLFTFLVLQGKSLTLAILLLKLILACKDSYAHLEARLAELIQYYEDDTEADCRWLIHFLETLRLTLTIYAENIRYDLVRRDASQPKFEVNVNRDSCWIFSQVKWENEGEWLEKKS